MVQGGEGKPSRVNGTSGAPYVAQGVDGGGGCQEPGRIKLRPAYQRETILPCKCSSCGLPVCMGCHGSERTSTAIALWELDRASRCAVGRRTAHALTLSLRHHVPL